MSAYETTWRSTTQDGWINWHQRRSRTNTSAFASRFSWWSNFGWSRLSRFFYPEVEALPGLVWKICIQERWIARMSDARAMQIAHVKCFTHTIRNILEIALLLLFYTWYMDDISIALSFRYLTLRSRMLTWNVLLWLPPSLSTFIS